jgi:predicted hotdog family 3-hydroxylacyl-ACP dehydratase
MLLIDRLLSVSDDGADLTAAAAPKPAWPLAGEEGVDALLAVELAAQTVGCLQGLRRGDDRPPAVGLLVGVKKAVFKARWLPYAADLEVRAHFLYGRDDFAAYTGGVYHNDRLLCEAALQIMVPPDQPPEASP